MEEPQNKGDLIQISARNIKYLTATDDIIVGGLDKLVKKGIELVGTSDKGFSDAVDNAVKEASRTIRSIQWVEVLTLSCKVEAGTIEEYQAKVMVFFEVER